MNPLLQRALESVFRWVLAVGAGWFVQRGIWTDSDATEYVLAGAAGLAVLAWGVWEKYASQRKLNTSIAVTNALTGPSVKNITPADIDVMIGTGSGAAAGTGSGVAPVLGTGDGTGNGLADLKQKVGLIKGLLLAAVLGGSLLVSGCGMKIARITPLPAEVEMVDANITTVIANSAELVVKADRFVLPITAMEAEAVKRGDITASVDSVFDTIVGAYVKAADYAIAQMKTGVKTWPQLKALVQPVLDAGQRVIDFTNSIGAIKTRAQSWLIAFRDALANLAGEFLMGGGLR